MVNCVSCSQWLPFEEFRAAKAVYEEESKPSVEGVAVGGRYPSWYHDWNPCSSDACRPICKEVDFMSIGTNDLIHYQWQQTVRTSKFHTFTNHITHHQFSLDQQRYQGSSRWRLMGWYVWWDGWWPKAVPLVGRAWWIFMSATSVLRTRSLMKKLILLRWKSTLTVPFTECSTNGRSPWTSKRIR